MSGRIVWCANVVNAENISNPSSFAPPSTWEELKLALLDILMPSNSVEECAIKLATFKTESLPSVSALVCPVKYVPGKLNVVPDMLSRAFSEVNGEPIPSEPRLAVICLNVPNDGPYYRPGPREYQLSASNLHDVAPVESDRELFMSAVSVFPTVDPAKLVDLQKEEFCPYFEYLRAPTSAPLPSGESKYTMSYFLLNEGLLFWSYLSGHLRKRSTFRDQLVVPTSLQKNVINSCHDLPASGCHQALKATFEIDSGGRPCPRMSVLILKRVCLANTTSHPTARPSCLWDTALSRARSNALLLILSSIKVCQKEIASSFLSSTILLDLSF